MKPTLFLLTLLIVNVLFLFAQVPPPNNCPTTSMACTNTPYNANIDLANPTTIHTIATPQRLIYAKATLNAKFSDPKYADDPGGYDPDKCPPPQNTFGDCGNDGGRLIYDVYYPTDINIDDYKSCPLPAVILFHAGGFYECTNLELPNVKTVCQELAKRGFVAYSVEY